MVPVITAASASNPGATWRVLWRPLIYVQSVAVICRQLESLYLGPFVASLDKDQPAGATGQVGRTTVLVTGTWRGFREYG